MPTTFYLVDGIGHSVWPGGTVAWRIAGQVLLLLAGLSTFAILMRFRWRPAALTHTPAIGAALGLIHLFPMYMIAGAYLFWEPVNRWSPFDANFVSVMAINLIIPMVTFSGSAYDGSFLTIPLTIAAFFILATRMKRKPDAELAN